eukprot:1149464-Pelagomonas_calceolata.AAC.2
MAAEVVVLLLEGLKPVLGRRQLEVLCQGNHFDKGMYMKGGLKSLGVQGPARSAKHGGLHSFCPWRLGLPQESSR